MKKSLENVNICHMVQSIDAIEGKNLKREFFYDPLKQYMTTSYSKIDTIAIESYTRTKKVVDFILAQEVNPPNKKKNYIEKPLKHPTIIKSKEVLKLKSELKPPSNPNGHTILKKISKPMNKLREVPPEDLT